VTTPSAWSASPACTCEAARTPNQVGPAGTAELRGGANRSVQSAWPPGYTGTAAGSTVVQPAAGPNTVTTNCSTRLPPLWMVRVVLAVPPGSTATFVSPSFTATPARSPLPAAPVVPAPLAGPGARAVPGGAVRGRGPPAGIGPGPRGPAGGSGGRGGAGRPLVRSPSQVR
jgi:hypothetical protein